ncbi:hypothetical protein AWC17_02345 [Mycobacterium nebraskense]|uniref:DUF2561 domain-containing protein n=1 Tax=Mycobacterium nebraskense TaxID=244292 RepID=A0A0F5N8Y5_9MYCO|nr:DUF2561 family protein [Mycobacterium nebraskense]KKC02733.1 membrane protein [Mycobacterium nebraskense]KLO37244.1 membrane protein [Mycobacterium nebraskense]MCV7118650.1 DUF2561 family protein [Mycobacterium nebraskense]ORW24980.1 hypothetical protein AWC17_02345 [Mycobacterium nebraskense]
MVSRYSAYRRLAGDDTISPDVIDRILIGACAAIWLVLLGVSVAAAVALADLGRGFHKAASSTHTTSWVLYAVIIVSALIIAGAIPMLLRARRMAQTEPAARGMTAPNRPPVRLMSQVPRTAAERARQPRVQAPAQADESEWSGEAVDRAWLRGTVLLMGAMGAALVAVATATYLMAVGHDGASWVAYGVAGAVTAGMPVIEWLHVRQLRRAIAAQ